MTPLPFDSIALRHKAAQLRNQGALIPPPYIPPAPPPPPAPPVVDPTYIHAIGQAVAMLLENEAARQEQPRITELENFLRGVLEQITR